MVRDCEIIAFEICDGSDSAGSCTGTFNRISVLVCPAIGKIVHIDSGYVDVQFSSSPRSDINGLLGTLITVFVFYVSSQIVFYIYIKNNSLRVFILVGDIKIVGVGFCNVLDGAGSSAGTIYRITAIVCPIISEPFHIIGGHSGVELSSPVWSNIDIPPRGLIALIIYCIGIQVVLGYNMKINNRIAVVLISDL